ncbi:MAG: CocE/NonD family hydrolase [Marinilabiliaceae bacterium]
MNIKIIEHTTIPMEDGTRLAARIWLPENAEEQPVPAILEYIPYRKRDFKAVRDDQMHGYFAEHGYAGVRVDLRGSGDSEGVLKDEYLQQELDDGIEVIKWLAAQPWCSGSVGMIGISWGGFNGLQIAALQPPELKAIITVASSDDRYADDVHYMGGALLTDNLSWASTMFAYNSCPPDPALVGDKWKEMWLDRLEGSGLWLKKWLEHQHRDDYWKHASVCEDYSAVQCPVFAISGWADGYTNTVFRLMEKLQVPRKGLVGPWGHQYPHQGGPGPVIDFFNECLRWWDQWLKGIDTGVKEEPMIRAWMQDSVSPISLKRPGRWVAENEWPVPGIREEKLNLLFGELSFDTNRRSRSELTIQSPLSVGLFAGKWCSYAESTDLPSDQREEDGGALIFDGPPLEEELEIMGAPRVELTLSSNKPIATVAVRISDVAPDGKATRVTYGLLNLTHRNSHEHPEELEVNKKYQVAVDMNNVAQNFPAGHQIRLAISTSYWPLAWPPPEPARLTIYTDESQLVLPVRPPKESDDKLRDMGKPNVTRDTPTTLLVPAHREWEVKHNLATNEVMLHVTNNDPQYRLDDINWTIRKDVTEKYSYKNNNYDTLRGEVISTRQFKRNDWEAYTVTRTILTSTRTHFWIRATLDAYEGDTRVFSKSWDERVARQL